MEDGPVEHPTSGIRHQASTKKINAPKFPDMGKNGIYSLASPCRISRREVLSKLRTLSRRYGTFIRQASTPATSGERVRPGAWFTR